MLGTEQILFTSRTPQGVRGLKPFDYDIIAKRIMSHSARSAWIETFILQNSNDCKVVALRKECVD
mgnify:CR=1 FL=1